MHKGGVNITAETPDRLTPDGRDFARNPDSFAARCPLKEFSSLYRAPQVATPPI